MRAAQNSGRFTFNNVWPMDYQCDACGKYQTNQKPYVYTPDENPDELRTLCDDCVRGEAADPRLVWWVEARRSA
jgi:hypothetical protein